MFDKITTVAVYVTDLERAKRFYTEILGFEVAADLPPDLCFLKSGSGRISIYLEGGKKPGSADSGTSRLGFFLESAKPASELYSHFKARGVRLLQDAPELVGDDIYAFQIADPDGNILDIAAGP